MVRTSAARRMTVVEESVSIAAPPERVFEYVADFTNLPSYNSEVIRARRLSPGREALGATFAVTVRAGPIRFGTRLEITATERPRFFQNRAVAGRLFVADEDRFFSPEGGGTRVTFRVRYRAPLGPVGALLDRAVLRRFSRAQLRGELAGLKRVLERGGE